MRMTLAYVIHGFQALAEPTRLRIATLLAVTKERACVCELSDALNEAAYNISRHLHVLEHAGLVNGTRDGRWVYYRYAPPAGTAGKHVTAVLVNLDEPEGRLAVDRQRFEARLALRKNGRCVIWKLKPESLEGNARGRHRRVRERLRV